MKKTLIQTISAVALAAGLAGCATTNTPSTRITKEAFGTVDGRPVDLYP
jgi:hypothetical protein